MRSASFPLAAILVVEVKRDADLSTTKKQGLAASIASEMNADGYFENKNGCSGNLHLSQTDPNRVSYADANPHKHAIPYVLPTGQ